MVPPFEGAIFWDLDGTLLSTGKGGRIALRAAILEHAGRDLDLTDLHTSGITDAESLDAALQLVGVEPEASLVRKIRSHYERGLPAALLQREGRILPGIVETLDGLAERGRVVNLLLTGNTFSSAAAKLERYGLAERFPHGGAFCEGPGGRLPIAERALKLAATLVPGFAPERGLLVGDTIKDVECAIAIGVRALGIATGDYSVEDLQAVGASWALEQIAGPLQLEELVLHGP